MPLYRFIAQKEKRPIVITEGIDRKRANLA
jgi:hypothetical protein